MGQGIAICTIVSVITLSLCRSGLAYSRQNRLILPGTGLETQGLLRQDSPGLEVLRQASSLVEASSIRWSTSDSTAKPPYPEEIHENGGRTGSSLPVFEDALWNKEGANAITSLVQLSLSPLDDSALALYHKVFRESIQGTAKPSFNYVRTHAALRSLAVTNLIIGSLLPELDKKRSFIRIIEKVVKKTAPKNETQEEAEVKEVVKVLNRFSGASVERIRQDSRAMAAVQHIICNVREGKRGGFAGLFESLASESIFTIAHSILHTGASLGFSFQPMLTSGLRLVQGCLRMAMKIQSMAGPALLLPGGVVGTVLQYFLRAFNLMFFPPLLAVTGGLAGAMGVACLLGVPTLLSEIYNFVSNKVLKGVTAAYKHIQLFRLRSDPHGARLLKSAFSGKFVVMLTQLWQLDSVGVETLENSVPSLTTFSSEVFSQGFLNGIVHFAREYTSLIEGEYLTAYEDETTKCYEQRILLTKTKLICEGTFRRLESFSSRSREVLNFISWMAFRDYITDLLLMVYNTARVSLEAQIKQSDNPSIETLRAAFAEVNLQDSLVANIVVKPRLQRDVHNFTSGVAGITTFFLLRKLHQWRPRSIGKAPTVGATLLGNASERQSASEKREDLSLVSQRLEAFAEVDLPPELEMAEPELKVVEDKSVTSAEATLLGKYAAKRDLMMMSLLRQSLRKLIRAFDSIFGRLEKMVRATVGRDRVQTCKLSDQKMCFNTDEATKARFAVLQFVLAAHLGVSIGMDEKLAESSQDLKEDFMSLVKDAAWFRYRSPTSRVLRRKTQWGLDLLIDHLFPQRKAEGKRDGPISEEHLTTIELAVTSNQSAASSVVRKLFKLTRLQCLNNGALFVLTTDLGIAKVFRPAPPITPEMKRSLCTPEHEFVEFNAWYTQNDVGGRLHVPGLAGINGFMVDSGIVLRARHDDESAAYLIEAALWSKGIPRVDALKAADLLVATKRALYSDRSWKEFFNDWTPTDLDYVQHNISAGMHLDRETYVDEERKALYSLDVSAEGFLELLVRSLESTLITAGSLSAGLSDLALIFPVAVGLEAVKMAEKNVTGLTSMLGRFQVILWDEYAAEKQRSRVARVVPHFQSSVGSVAPPQRRTNAFYRPSISDAFAREEGTIDPLFADWCEELYSRASSSNIDEPGLARLAAQDAGIIQCSLLRFLGKRQKGEPSEKEKNAVFKYLRQVTQLLRKAKKTNRYSWKRYLNAKPPRNGEYHEQTDSVRSAIKRSLITLRKRVSRGTRRLAHKIRSEAAKRLLGIRIFNILRGPEFLRTLHLAAVEAFADQALFPSSVLIHPTTLAAFTRIRTLIKFEVLPIMDRPEGAEIITQMKMMPTPSPAMKRLIERFEAQLRAAKTKFGPSYRRHVRQCAGYLWLLNIASAAPAYASTNLPRLFSRFVSIIDGPTEERRGEYLITRRSLAYLEQAGMKLVLKAGDAVALLEKSSVESRGEAFVHHTLGLSNISPASLPLAAAGRKLHHPRLGHPSLLLFCSLAIPTVADPNFQSRRLAGLKQMKELQKLSVTSESPLYFQINREATSEGLDFHDLESLIRVAQNVQLRSEASQKIELTAAFLLHAPLMKGLEIMGLVNETVGSKFGTSPLQCTPEDKSSGTWYTIPINGSSRLRMLTSLLIQLGDAEDVLERLEASNMAAVSADGGFSESFATVTTLKTEAPPQFSTDGERSGSIEEESKSRNTQISEQNVSSGNDSENEGTWTPQLSVDREQNGKPSKTNVNTAPSMDLRPPAESKAERPGRDYSSDYPFKMAIKADQEGLRNAKATVQHLMQQASLFEAHSSAFASIFHTLISIAQLPSRLYNSVSTRFVDSLATAALGRPWRTQRKWKLRLGWQKRRSIRRRTALRRPFGGGQTEYAASAANSVNRSFSTVLLPFSIKEALGDIRKKWKRLLKTDYLAVISAACKQDADLWLKDELEANGRAVGEAAEQRQTVDAMTTNEQFKKTHESRQQLCVHPLWFELRARIFVEQDMLEAERLFSYFVRMGIENSKLVQQSADQALLDHLWEQLLEMGVLGDKASPEASAAVRGRLQQAVESVSKKRPFMAIEPVRELVIGMLEHLLQTPNMAKEGLREMLEQLQVLAMERAAAFLLSKAAGVEQDVAEDAVKNLIRPQPEDGTREFVPGEGPRASNLQAWLIQMYFVADPLLLLSRPSIFKPVVVLIEIINKTTHPRSPVYTIWRKALKSTRQLAIASLELLLRLPRAYVRYPQKTD